MYYVYILKCSNGDFYKGCTSNIEDRLLRHKKGQVVATRDLLPIELISYITFNDKYKAYSFEKFLKSGTGRSFINKRLIFGKPFFVVVVADENHWVRTAKPSAKEERLR